MPLSRRTIDGAGVSLVLSVETGPEMQKLVRDVKGHFIPGMQAAVASAHSTMMWIYQKEIYDELKRKQAAYPTGNRRGTGKSNSAFYKALIADFTVSPLGKMIPPAMGWTINLDDELNARIRDPETGDAYWRAVEEGYSRTAKGHMFTSHPLGSGKLVRPGLERGVQARMPQVGSAHRFQYSFGGYNFVEDGSRKAQKKIRDNAARYYLQHLPLPDGMRAVFKHFGAGGTSANLPMSPDPRLNQGD